MLFNFREKKKGEENEEENEEEEEEEEEEEKNVGKLSFCFKYEFLATNNRKYPKKFTTFEAMGGSFILFFSSFLILLLTKVNVGKTR